MEYHNPEEAVANVQKWAEDNPEDGDWKKQDPTVLKKGTPVLYVDANAGEIETGKVFSVSYKNGVLESIGIDFDDGDFDEFYESAFNSCIFDSPERAEHALKVGDDAK